MALEAAFSSWITKEVQQASIVQVDARPVNAPSLIIEDLTTAGVALSSKAVHNLPVVGWWLMPAASLMACALRVVLIFRGISDTCFRILKELNFGQEQTISESLPLGGAQSKHSLTDANRIDSQVGFLPRLSKQVQELNPGLLTF
jgi:hypothetical protein